MKYPRQENWLLPSSTSPFCLWDTNFNSEKSEDGRVSSCCAAQSTAAKEGTAHTEAELSLLWSHLEHYSLFSADFDISPRRLCPGALISSWASVHLLWLHPLSWFSIYVQLFPFQEVFSQAKQRAWLTNSLSTMKNLVDSNLIPRTDSNPFQILPVQGSESILQMLTNSFFDKIMLLLFVK